MKLLLLTSRFPYPLEKGDKLRIYHQLSILARKHEIVLFALSDQEVSDSDYAQVAQWCKRIYLFRLQKWRIAFRLLGAFLSRQPFQVSYFYSQTLHNRLIRIFEEEQPDHIYCQLIRMAKYAETLSTPATIDYMDAFSLGLRRRAQMEKGVKRWLISREAKRVGQYEKQVFNRFVHHTIIAKGDRDALCDTKAIREIHVVPNGVDTTFFQPGSDNHADYEILFVGNMQYFPNVSAAKFIVDEVMPLVWEKRNQVRVLIAGAEPHPDVVALGQYPQVKVSGWLPDIREAYKQGYLFVAPLQVGSGQQNKILEAMAMQLAVITTPLVNQAIGASHEKELLLATYAYEFANAIDNLLDNPQQVQTMGSYARRFVKDHYSWEASTQLLEDIWMHNKAQ